MNSRRNLLALAAAVVTLAAVMTMLVAIPSRGALRPTVSEVAQGLTCQCGCGLTVANCNMPTCSFSVPARDRIERMIAQGKSSPDIIAFFRHQYGEKVLSSPTTQGFNILAWTMPFIALAIGGVFIAATARRWHRAKDAPESGQNARQNGGQDASQSDAPPSDDFDPELRKELEGELRDEASK